MDYIKFTPAMSNNWSRAQVEIVKQRPWAIDRIKNSMTASQLESKLYLGTELKKIGSGWSNVAVIGGWYCHFLSTVLIDNLDCKFVCNYEIDKDAQLISYKFNRRYKEEKKYKSHKKNLFMDNSLAQEQEKRGLVDLVINTSCEHMFDMKAMKNKHFDTTSPLFVLQSTNDDQYDDHINCVSSADELAEQGGLVHIDYSGSKQLSNGMTRFMVIGR
tara:strand:- start:88 stop:735 length:648 start_codon:yes stop_codon:yes gene_type:complete